MTDTHDKRSALLREAGRRGGAAGRGERKSRGAEAMRAMLAMRWGDTRTRFMRSTGGAIPADLSEALERNGWNVARAARALGISVQTIYGRIRAIRVRNSDAGQ